MRLESKAAGHITLVNLGRNQRRIDLEQNVRETGSKVCAVDGSVSGRLRRVHIFTLSAVEFDGFGVSNVGETDGKEGVGTAEDAGATAEVAFLIFLELLEGGVSR